MSNSNWVPGANIFIYKNKQYRVICKSKVKAEGIAAVLDGYGIVHTDTIHKDKEWIDVVIYECLYDNPDGQVWVREYNQFFELFKPES